MIENIPAVPTKTNYSMSKPDGMKTVFRTKFIEREYIVELGLMVWNGEQIRPKPGDRIIEGDLEYEVVENESQQCCRPVDSTETYIRIFVHKSSVTSYGGNGGSGECNHRPMTEQEVNDLVNNILNHETTHYREMTEQEVSDLVTGILGD